LIALALVNHYSSKSDTVTPPVALAPKLLKEVKTTDISPGSTDVNTIVFEYNDKYQIIKKYYSESPSNYAMYSYSGDLPISSKNYSNGILTEEKTNPIIVSGNVYTQLTVTNNSTGSKDSTFVQYTFEDNDIAQFRVLIKQSTMTLDMKNGYVYSGNVLTSTDYTSFMNGVQGNIISLAVRKTDDKSNPYLNASRVNKILMAIGQEPLARGKNNLQEVADISPSGGIRNYTHTYDADDYPLSTAYVNGASNIRIDYTYIR
jgi:hypothetical protein